MAHYQGLHYRPVGDAASSYHGHGHHYSQQTGFVKQHPINCSCPDCYQRVDNTVTSVRSSRGSSSCCNTGCTLICCCLILILKAIILAWLTWYLLSAHSQAGEGCNCCSTRAVLFEDKFRDDVCFLRPCDDRSHKSNCQRGHWCYRDGPPYGGCGRHYQHYHNDSGRSYCTPRQKHGGHGCRHSSSHHRTHKDDCNYSLFSLKRYECADDADVSISDDHKLCVDSRPFTRTLPANGDGAVPNGLLDRYKFWALSEQGFQLPSKSSCEELLYTVKMSCNVRGAGKHPFQQRHVPTPYEDPRLGSCFASVLSLPDYNGHHSKGKGSWLEAGWILTDRSIFPSYSMLPFGKPSFGGNMSDYYGFTQLGPHRFREVWEFHQLSVALNPKLQLLRWLLDGVEIWRVDRVGFPLWRCGRVMDHGGCPEAIFPDTVNVGFGTATYLDWHHFHNGSCTPNPGLVRLSSAPEHYRNPFELSDSGSSVSPDEFTDEASHRYNRLWKDNGAELKLEWLKVTQQRCGCLT